MGDISKITLPNGTSYDLKDAKKTGIYPVIGTQTAATGSWTGKIDVPALYDGLTIAYFLPYAGSGNATLNLTLSGGGTTGAKNCYYNASRLTTHYPAGSTILMTYWSAGSIKVSGTATTDDRWCCDADYNTNTNTYVTQTATTTSANYEVLFSATADNTTRTEGARKNSNLLFNPSTGNLQATQLNGVAIGTSPKFTDTTALGSMTGTLGVGNGGTGQTSAVNAANSLINALTTGSSTPEDNDYYISQYVNGGTTTTTYHRRKHSILWEYIKSKISSVLGLTATSYGGSAAKVNNHTVESDVPSNAKFTDTTYGTTYAAESVPNNTTFATQGSVYNVYNAATKHTTATASLTVAGWSSNSQAVTVSGVTASNTVIVSPAPASVAAWAAAGVYCSAQAANKLTFACSTTPTAALTANVVIMN